ncbi:MAG TPA: bacteriocin fulvocin C-related protein [Umezawaea sp.]|nr:bacteriocin fulvocin C-related protein [Umezawaea sp.]
MQNPERERWILAFDAECGVCREISAAIADASREKLEVMPLASPDVRSWRERALGAAAPWTPTLIQLSETRIRAWTNRGMVLPLVRRLGPRSTMRVISALGELQQQRKDRNGPENARRNLMTRSQFLRFAAGAVAASGIVLTGRTPAFAAGEATEARAWVAANLSRLPQRYDDLIGYPMTYRKEIWKASAPRLRSQWWLEQLGRYQATHGDLTAEQNAVMTQTLKLAADETTFNFEQADRSELMRQVKGLAASATDAFGTEEAHAVFATLGAAENPVTRPEPCCTMPGCDCNHDQEPGLNWCGSRDCIYYITKPCAVYCCDCGFLLLARCDGRCL